VEIIDKSIKQSRAKCIPVPTAEELMENMDGSVKYSKVDLKAACPTNRP
jgi:hypothetical protein